MNTLEQRVVDMRGVIASVGVFVVGVLVIMASSEFDALGAVFPRAIATLMMVLAVCYVFFALRRPSRGVQIPAGSQWRRVAMFGVMLAWALLLEPLGFLATSLLCYGAALLISNYDRWTPRMALLYCGSGAVILVGLFLLFRLVLQVPLPSGILI